MNDQKKQQHQAWQWEQALVEEYYDHRWRQMLEPLCETFQRWKAGKLDYEAVDDAIEKAYKEKIMLNNLFGQRHDRAAALIHWWDREWFDTWIKDHRPPSDVQLPQSPSLAADEQETS